MSAPPVGCVLPWLSSSPRGVPLPWALTRSLSAQMAKKKKTNLTSPHARTWLLRRAWAQTPGETPDRRRERKKGDTLKLRSDRKRKGKVREWGGRGERSCCPLNVSCQQPMLLFYTPDLFVLQCTQHSSLSLSLLSPFHSVPWLTPLACWTVAKVV